MSVGRPSHRDAIATVVTRRAPRRVKMIIAAMLGIALLATAACTDASTPQTSATQKTLVIHDDVGKSVTANFNPFSVTALPGTTGFLYEPLIANTPAQPGKDIPWLATAVKIAEDGKSVSYTIRKGVKWSDGKPLTVDDVVFTFKSIKDDDALNTSGLPFKSVKASGDTVTVSFGRRITALISQLNNTAIVPKHSFSGQDLVKWTNEKPVGSGPFTLDKINTQQYELKKRPDYWQADKVKVDRIRYPATTPETFSTELSQGKLDWSGGFLANVDKIFVAKDREHNKYWYPGDGQTNLYLNLRKKPFDDLQLRKAISTALDRPKMAEQAEAGLQEPLHPSGLVLPAQKDFLPEGTADDKLPYDVNAANQMLDKAGYKKGSDGVRASPDGKKLSFPLTVPSGWPDTVQESKVISNQLKKVGIQAKPQGVDAAVWSDAIGKGTYTMTIKGEAMGATPYYLYYRLLSSSFIKPSGQKQTGNTARFKSAKADKLLDQYENTTDEAEQKAAIQGLAKIYTDELPVVPLLQAADWFNYRTTKFTGWPSEQDPYAMPAPYNFPDRLLIITHLQPVTG